MHNTDCDARRYSLQTTYQCLAWIKEYAWMITMDLPEQSNVSFPCHISYAAKALVWFTGNIFNLHFPSNVLRLVLSSIN